MATAIKFMDVNHVQNATTVLTLSSNDTSANKASLITNDRSDYWEVSGANTEESIQADLISSAHGVDFVSLIGEFDTAFEVATNATIKIEANNTPVWTSPSLSETAVRSDSGIFHNFATTQNYRFWRVVITDTGTSFDILDRHARFSHLAFGSCLTVTGTNVAIGFSKARFNPSPIQTSETGRTFANSRASYQTFGGMTINLIPAAERRALEDFIDTVAVHTPFIVSIDPALALSTELAELTKFCHFEGQVTMSHIIRDYFSMAFSLREAV